MNLRPRRAAFLGACLLFALVGPTAFGKMAAQAAPLSAVAEAFDTAHDRAFDFWIGEWDVNLRVQQNDASWQDTRRARAHVSRILGGKAILELWDEQKEGLDAIRGWSLRYFDHEAEEWVLHLNWPGPNRSGISSLRGTFRHGRGEFFSQRPTEDGEVLISRYTFSDVSPTSLRWDDAFSRDGGKTWSNNWIMEFTRRAEVANWPRAGEVHHTYYDGARCDRPEFRTWERLIGSWAGTLREEREGLDPQELDVAFSASPALDGCAVIGLLHWSQDGRPREEFSFFSFNTYADRLEQARLEDAPGTGLRQVYGTIVDDRIELRSPPSDPAPEHVVWELEGDDMLRMTLRHDGLLREIALRRRPALAPALAQLAPLVGGEWRTEFPNGFTDVQIYEPMADGRFLRNVHHVRSPDGEVVYEGETVYGWDAPTEQLRWWYFNSTGGRIEGTLSGGEDGTLVYEGENHAPTEQTSRVRGSFVLDPGDPGRYTSVTWFWKDDRWQVERELVYRRRPGVE